MRFLFKLVAFLILAPIFLGTLAVLAVVAIVGLPILWEEFVARGSAPPPEPPPNEEFGEA